MSCLARKILPASLATISAMTFHRSNNRFVALMDNSISVRRTTRINNLTRRGNLNSFSSTTLKIITCRRLKLKKTMTAHTLYWRSCRHPRAVLQVLPITTKTCQERDWGRPVPAVLLQEENSLKTRVSPVAWAETRCLNWRQTTARQDWDMEITRDKSLPLWKMQNQTSLMGSWQVNSDYQLDSVFNKKWGRSSLAVSAKCLVRQLIGITRSSCLVWLKDQCRAFCIRTS